MNFPGPDTRSSRASLLRTRFRAASEMLVSALSLSALLLSSPAIASANAGCGPLLLVGGGQRPPAALAAWMKEASALHESGRLTSVIVIAWASGEPEESFEAIRAELVLTGEGAFIAPSLRAPKDEKDAANFLQALGEAHAVWFTGGDQNRIADALERFPTIGDTLRGRSSAGSLAVGGTSAGTAIQSKRMFTGNEDLTRIDPGAIALREGLGLLPAHVLVDQHFLRRQRQNRLISALLAGAATVGTGIDEDNAMLVRDCTRATPFGASPLSVYRTVPSVPERVTLDLVKEGSEISLAF